MEEQILLTVFTDPMMGLSYESEPIMDALARRYGERLAIRYVMSVLVRDVSDFMTSAERALPPEQGILLYCKRLAQIYKSEESIGGLPINMEDFRLLIRSIAAPGHCVLLIKPRRLYPRTRRRPFSCASAMPRFRIAARPHTKRRSLLLPVSPVSTSRLFSRLTGTDAARQRWSGILPLREVWAFILSQRICSNAETRGCCCKALI